MHKKNRLQGLAFALCLIMVFFAGCSHASKYQREDAADVSLKNRDQDISGQLTYKGSMELQYARKFAVDYYQGGYALISVADERKYLVVPEGGKQPEDLEEGIVVLEQPMEHIYLVATAVMDMFCKLEALDTIRFSGQQAEGWCIEEAQEKMEQGEILYAGKYSMPDYERIVSEGCSLAIENNMISHTPEVIEKLEDFGIPVWIDLSSYESHPLGRAEWVKLYGVLLGKEELASQVFEGQVGAVERAAEGNAPEKSVAFFYFATNGMVQVRVSSDYVPKMIELAGGKYIFEDLGKKGSNRSSMAMQMEDFYQAAKDADYLIYNSAIDGEVAKVEELLEREGLLKDFKAVKEGNVWCATRDLYQQPMSIGQMVEDIHNMLSGDQEKEKGIVYMHRLE